MNKLFALIVLFSIPAIAEQEFQLSGFGTIGAVYSDSERYSFRTDYSQKGHGVDKGLDFTATSVLGLQASYVLNTELDFVYQVVYRDQDDIDFDNATDLAFLRYAPSPDWSFRLGRTAFDIYLLTEYRDVGIAYPWAHVPVETYGVVPYRYIDGADVTYRKQFNNFTLSTKLFTGENEVLFYGFIENSSHQNIKLNKIYGLSLDFQSTNWVFKLKHTNVNVATEVNISELVSALTGLSAGVPGFDAIWPNAIELAMDLSLKDKPAEYSSISGRYDFSRWSIISEISTVKADRILLPTINTGYLSVIFHAGRHSFFGTFAESEKDDFDLTEQNIDQQALRLIPGGSELFFGVDSVLKGSGSDQKTMSLGWRWDFNDRVALKIQWDHVDVTERGSSLLLRSLNTIELKDNFNVGFTNVSFTF